MHEDAKVASEKTSLRDAANIEDGEVIEEKKTYRQKLAAFLQSNAVQYTVIAFVVIDGLIVILELLIDLEIIKFPEEGNGHDVLNSTYDSHESITHTANVDEATYAPLMVMPDPHHGNGGHHHVKHRGRHHNHHNDHSIVTQTIATVTHFLLNSTDDEYHGNFSLHGDAHYDDHHGGHHGAHHHSNKEIAEHTLHYCSLAILCLFLVEVICKIIAEGTHLLKHKAEVLDAFVVIISFTLDVVFSFVDVAQAAKDAAGLMVMLRLWRVTRLINGVIISVQMEADKKVHKIEVVLHAAERENEQLRDKLKLLQEELETLKNKLKKTDDKILDSVSQSTSQSALQNISQKTDEDVIAQTPLTPSPATTTTTSTVSALAAPAKDPKSSSTSQSSKSMFMVFEDKKDKSSAGDGQGAKVIGPKPPVFVVPVNEGSPKHTATNAGYEAENHPHQILHFPQPPTRRSSKDDHPALSSIQPYISPNYPVPESASKKKVLISPTQPTLPKHIIGDQPIANGSQKHSVASQYSPPSSSVDMPRKPSISSPADQKKESVDKGHENSQSVQPNKQLALSDPQLIMSTPLPLTGSKTSPTNGNEQVIPLIPPPTSKRSSEGRKKSVPNNFSSGHQALKSPPRPENTVKPTSGVLSPGSMGAKKLISGQSLEHGDHKLQGEHSSPPAAIILPPVSSATTRKKAANGQNSEYVPLKSPRQPSPPISENVFFEIDNKPRSSSFLGDAMSDAPAEKDPGAPR